MRQKPGRTLFGLALILCSALAPTALYAQVNTGTISGTVRDKSGAAIPNAKVTIRNMGTGELQHLTSNSSGLYVSLPLYAGQYELAAEAAGFAKETQRVTLTVAQRLEADFTMQVGAITQTISVRANAVALQSESSTLSSFESERNIENLPLNGPNFAQLVGLGAGVMPAQTTVGAGGGSAPIAVKRGAVGYSMNGIRYRDNDFLVDGILDNENHNGQGIALYPPIDAIEEFRDETSVADAQFGRAGGGTVNLIYKSGTEHYHGDLFEFFRNSGLDARNFFDATIPEFRRNQFGGTLGGPLIPGQNPKTFFFVDYQGVRTRIGQTFINTVPTPAARSGDFSQYRQTIFNPLLQTTLPNGKVERSPFVGNIVPPAMIDSVGQKLINLYPDPNLAGIANNFTYAPVTAITENDADFKVNRTFTAADSGWFRYSRTNDTEFDPGALPAPAVGGGSPTGTTFQPADQAVVSETHIFSPQMVNQAEFGWTRLDLTSNNLDHGQYLASDIGIPGANVPGNPLTSGLPLFNITGFTALGENGFTPAIIVSNNYQWNDDLTYVRGRHTFKAGFQFIRLQYNAFQSSALRGTMSFTTAYTSNPASPSGTGLGAADLLLGRPISGSINFLSGGTRGLRKSDVAGYFQDTWKATSRLTLNLGLRYENYIGWPWTEVYNRMYQFVPAAETVEQVGTNGIPRSGVYGRNDNFAPRVGLAYRVRSKTVFRSAFGTFYSDPDLPLTNLIVVNPPEAVATAFTNSQFDFAAAHPASAGFSRPAVGVIPGSPLYANDPHSKIETIYQWNAAVEQQLPGNILLTVAYVGTKGTYLGSQRDINQPVPGTTPIVQRRPYPVFQSIYSTEDIDNSAFNGLEVSAEHRFSHGLDFLLSYTYSHAIDYSSNTAAAPMDAYNLLLDRGNADTDVPNHLMVSSTYLLPFAVKGRLGALANGWQANGIFTDYSGLPFSVGSSTNTLNNGASSRASRICGGALANPTVSDWFSLSCFTPPGFEQWGTAGRNILRGPTTTELDFSVFKNFALNASESKTLQFRAEAFNLFNTPLFNNPNATIGSPSAGTISSAGAPITMQRISREIQFGVKFLF